MPKLSIITVCFNEAENIGRTLSSVFEQQFSDYEYIVIDGASTDGTVEIIEKHSSRLAHFISEQDSGIYNAQNKGLALARGEYVMFLNSGDYLCNPFVLERIFADNPTEEILYGDIIVLLESGFMIRKKTPRNISRHYMYSDSISHPASLIRRTLFDRLGKYDETYRIAADYEFFLKALFAEKVKTRYYTFPFSVFNYWGISSLKENRALVQKERLKAQSRVFSSSEISRMRFAAPFYNAFVKYPLLVVCAVLSRLSKSFLKKEAV